MLFASLLRYSADSRLADRKILTVRSEPPKTRPVGSSVLRILDAGATLTSRLQSFELEMLVKAEQLAALAGEQGDLVQVTINAGEIARRAAVTATA